MGNEEFELGTGLRNFLNLGTGPAVTGQSGKHQGNILVDGKSLYNTKQIERKCPIKKLDN